MVFRPKHVISARPNGTPATTTLKSAYGYGYNAAGWITSSTTLSGTDALTHNASGRLTDECGPQLVTPTHCNHWTYDANGNLLSAVGDSGATDVYTYTAGAGGQINEQVAGGSSDSPPTATIRLAYDGHGDTTSISNAVGQTAQPTDPGYKKYARLETFAYDAQQRPITVTRLDSTKVGTQTIVTPLTATMQYNADGLRADYRLTPDPRTGKQPVDTRFAYRDGQLASATVTDITGTLLYRNTFIYGPSGEPLELLRTNPDGTTSRYWYVLDGLGSVVALTDQNGKVVDRYAYDAWGEETSNDATDETVPQQLRYRGYYYDEKLTYYWVSVRYYDPEGMRWLQPDPSDQDGVRTYAYVGDDPVDAADPDGLCRIDIRFRPVTFAPFARHAYIRLSDRTGTYGCEANPGNPTDLINPFAQPKLVGTIRSIRAITGKSSKEEANMRYPTLRYLNDNTSCQYYINQLRVTVAKLTRADIDYVIPGHYNSNSFAFTAVTRLRGKSIDPMPPSTNAPRGAFAPGWGQYIPCLDGENNPPCRLYRLEHRDTHGEL